MSLSRSQYLRNLLEYNGFYSQSQQVKNVEKIDFGEGMALDIWIAPADAVFLWEP